MAADKVGASLKTPTALLLDDKNNFAAFGFDAEQWYKEFAEDILPDGYCRFFKFKNFKMSIHKKKVFSLFFQVNICNFCTFLDSWSSQQAINSEKFSLILANNLDVTEGKTFLFKRDIQTC